jgi:hypothetical protein
MVTLIQKRHGLSRCDPPQLVAKIWIIDLENVALVPSIVEPPNSP